MGDKRESVGNDVIDGDSVGLLALVGEGWIVFAVDKDGLPVPNATAGASVL